MAMQAAMTSCAALVWSLLTGVYGHGRLIKPTPRNGGLNPSGTENAPATINDATATNFICRHATRNSQVPLAAVTAGGTLTLQWTTPAAHVGDCAIYISYDIAEDLVNQRYFKIANLPDCKSEQNTDVTITVPDFLPAGQAILRWDWYALHVRPTIEMYVQCADIQVTGSSNSVLASQLTTYKITDPPIYPSTGTEGVGFRNAFNPSSEQYMTGTACANGITINKCPLTAVGMTGNTRDGGNIGSHNTAAPTLAPGATLATTSQAPAATSATTSLAPGASSATTSNPGTGDCAVHKVVAGDTLFEIAKQFTDAGKAVTFQQICDLNGLSDCNVIFPGEMLVIPYAGSLCGNLVATTTTTVAASSTEHGHSTSFLLLTLPLFVCGTFDLSIA